MAKLMKLIAGISFVTTVVMSALYHKLHNDLSLTLAITFGTIAYHFIMRLAVGLGINKILHNKVNYQRKWFQLRSFEEKIYKALKVKRWKGKMPTYSPATFSVEEHSLDEIVQAMCQAEIVHEVIAVLSFVPLLTVPVFGAFPVFLITSVLAACFDLMFVIMQRYNRPRIIKLMKRKGDKR